MSKVLAITGMHRSGTSVMAGYLQSCGLDIGKNLIGPTYGNPNGHFEDVEIEKLQEEILLDNGIVLKIAQEPLTINPEHMSAFDNIIRDRAEKYLWGWKDPRTCLFLDQWKKRIPGLRVVALFRNWPNVLQSLVRRDRRQDASVLKKLVVPIWHSSANRWLMNRYLDTWHRYNSELIRFAAAYPDDIVFVQIQRMLAEEEQFNDQMNRWDMGLDMTPFRKWFKHSDFHANLKSRITVDDQKAKSADQLYKTMLEHSRRNVRIL